MKIPDEEIEKAKDFFTKFVSEGKDKIVSETIIKMYKETKRIEVKKSERKFVNFLYWEEKKSLREIGKLLGLTQEGVRLKMKKYGIERRRVGCPRGVEGEPMFKSLEEYFEYVRRTGKESVSYLYKFIYPLKEAMKCEVCGGKRFLRFHYLRKPVTSMKDTQLICTTCFYANMRKGINNLVRDEICKKYISGVSGVELAREYKVGTSNIYQILRVRKVKTRHVWDYIKRKREE